jgi:hypothetical protein
MYCHLHFGTLFSFVSFFVLFLILYLQHPEEVIPRRKGKTDLETD